MMRMSIGEHETAKAKASNILSIYPLIFIPGYIAEPLDSKSTTAILKQVI
jgi:hypothetical protein